MIGYPRFGEGILRMTKKLWLLGLCLAGLAVIANGQKPAPPSSEPTSVSRYQLVAAQVESQGDQPTTTVTTHEVFMLDTQTGKVWRYTAQNVGKSPQGSPGQTMIIPEAFIMVEVRQDRFGPAPEFLGEPPKK